MGSDLRKMRKEERARSKQLRKDRLVQTRVDRRLQKILVDKARQQRMSVSNLVRNILEDAFGLAPPQEEPASSEEPQALAEPQLEHIYAWNAVKLGKAVDCSRCGNSMEAGEAAMIGLSEDPEADRAWLCTECSDEM
ncbi:MAG: hypothetical protein K0V04_19170 [Deltaproteobacteria bacterium]|nr:hypothetical protein [Deltaproteobacteria bacterium]